LDPPPLTNTATLAGPASRVAAARGAGARRCFDAPARLDARRGRDHARAAEVHDIAGEGGHGSAASCEVPSAPVAEASQGRWAHRFL